MFTITINRPTKKNMAILDLEKFPFSLRELKSAYRKAIHASHPDSNKGVSDDLVKKVISAYESLIHLAMDVTEEEKKAANEKIVQASGDIFASKLTKVCPYCKGAKTVKGFRYEDCPSCLRKTYRGINFGDTVYSTGFKVIKCRPCNGTGKFTQRNTKKVVTCLACKGSGKKKVICNRCKGSGSIGVEHSSNCYPCKGEGVIKVDPFNPVIPEGGVAVKL